MILAFLGDNSFLREQAAKEFIDGFIGMHGAHAIDRFSADETNLNTLLAAVSSAPFLSPKRLIVLRDIAGNKDIADGFEKLVDSVSDTSDLIIIESQIDGRSKYVQTLRKKVDVREFVQPDSESLVRWIEKEAKDMGGTISRGDATFLVERVGTNQQLVSQELTKLLNFNHVINKDSILLLTDYTPQSSIFAMLEAAFNGQIGRALELYQEQRLQGMEPQAILGMIAWQLHILAVVKTGQNKTSEQIASAAKLNPFVVRKSQKITNNLTTSELLALVKMAADTDLSLKTTKTNADNAVTALLMACASTA